MAFVGLISRSRFKFPISSNNRRNFMAEVVSLPFMMRLLTSGGCNGFFINLSLAPAFSKKHAGSY